MRGAREAAQWKRRKQDCRKPGWRDTHVEAQQQQQRSTSTAGAICPPLPVQSSEHIRSRWRGATFSELASISRVLTAGRSGLPPPPTSAKKFSAEKNEKFSLEPAKLSSRTSPAATKLHEGCWLRGENVPREGFQPLLLPPHSPQTRLGEKREVEG